MTLSHKRSSLILIIFSILLTGCSQRKVMKEMSASPKIEKITDFDNAILTRDNLKQKNTDSKDHRANLRIENHRILGKTEFFSVSLADIQEAEGDAKDVIYSQKSFNGHIRFDMGDGIIYATGEPDRQSDPQQRLLIGVLLTDKRYSITGGLKSGIKESELESLDFAWEDWKPAEPDAFTKAIQSSDLFAFDNVKSAVEKVTEVIDGHPIDRTICIQAYLMEGIVSAAVLRLNTDSFYRFSVRDLFVKGHKILENKLFSITELNEIEEMGESLQKTTTQEGANGHFNYYSGEGIIYVVFSNGENQYENLYSIILTDDKYSFACGLKIGLTEEALTDLEIPFISYDKGSIGQEFGTYLLRQEEGPLAELDYDKIYFYEASISEKEDDEYESSQGGDSWGIIAFVKQGKVIAACTDFPTAN